jgi:hypothetical protein
VAEPDHEVPRQKDSYIRKKVLDRVCEFLDVRGF